MLLPSRPRRFESKRGVPWRDQVYGAALFCQTHGMAFLRGPYPRAFAHRGWHIDDLAGCENSLAAFRRARAEGFRYLETDVHATADGHLVAFHDASLDRVTDTKGPIAAMTWKQVQRARIRGRMPIPTLAEILAELPDCFINIDPKSDSAVEPLIALLNEAQAWSRVCIGSFSERRLAAVRAAAPAEAAVAIGPRSAAVLVARSMTRQPWSGGHAVAAQLPATRWGMPVVTSRLISTAHRAGLEVHVWTVDDVTEIRRLLDMGVDGVMTDRPDRLRAELDRRGLWRDSQ